MFYYHPIFSWLSTRKTSTWFWGIFIIAFAFFSLIKNEPVFMDGDPFYHAKITQLMLEGKHSVKYFPWLPMSVFTGGYTDHHFLFHIFLLPFNQMIGDPLIAIRVATSFFSALFLAILYLFFKRLIPQTPLFPMMLVLISSSLMFRLSLDKAPALSLIFLFCGLYAMIKKKYLALFSISFLTVWLYSAWPLMGIGVVFYCCAHALAELLASRGAYSFRHVFLKCRLLLISCVGGLLLGIILNPYFPYNIIFYKTHLFSIALITSGISFGIGSEWLPIDPVSFAQNNLLFMVFWICALCWTLLQILSRVRSSPLSVYAQTPSSYSTRTLFFMFFSFFLFFATMKSQRMGEYFIPIGSAFIVFALQDFFRRTPWREWMASLRASLENSFFSLQHIFCFMIGIFCITLFLQWSFSSYASLWRDVTNGTYSFYSMARVGAYISRTLPKGSLIINDDWSYFSQLLYYADTQRFAWGLDPTFTHDAHPEFFSAVSGLGKKEKYENVSDTLKKTLHAPYLLIAKQAYAPEKRLALLAKRDKGLKKIYEDDEALLYEVR